MADLTVNIRNLAFGGDGVGEVCEATDESLLGISAFVPFTVPGERIHARILEKKKRFVRAELIELPIEPSEHRIKPECRFFGICGGCELQHIDYAEQLRLKFEMIRGALRAGRLSSQAVEALQQIVPSEPFGYRRRVTLHLSQTGLIGFYREHSRSVVSIDRCPVATPEISALLPKLPSFAHQVKGKVSSVVLESDAAGTVAVLKSAYALTKRDIELIIGEARKCFESAVLLSGNESVGGFGREILELELSNGFPLRYPAGNFSQVNHEINRSLVEYVVENSEVERNTAVFDLYAGAGNFTLPLARHGAKVTAVELDPRLVHLGKQNAERLRLPVNYLVSSVEAFLKKNSQTPELIVADPPRSGLGSSKLPPAKRIILISCHLPSCVRDLSTLIESGYHVKEIQPFDMFAQTTYVEIVSVLERTVEE